MNERRPTDSPRFIGNESERQIAREAFEVLRSQGRFMSEIAPIRVHLSALTEYLKRDIKTNEASVRSALAANAAIFSIDEDNEGQPIVLTTRSGKAPAPGHTGLQHDFKSRFMPPLSKPATAPEPTNTRPGVDPAQNPRESLPGNGDGAAPSKFPPGKPPLKRSDGEFRQGKTPSIENGGQKSGSRSAGKQSAANRGRSRSGCMTELS